eukprot:467218-Hanusia_phi.AAC.1
MKINRLKTFKQGWPHEFSSPNPLQLARSGFEYRPSSVSNDSVFCSSCKLCVSGWQEGDDPFFLHRYKSPACQLVRGDDLDGSTFLGGDDCTARCRDQTFVVCKGSVDVRLRLDRGRESRGENEQQEGVDLRGEWGREEKSDRDRDSGESCLLHVLLQSGSDIVSDREAAASPVCVCRLRVTGDEYEAGEACSTVLDQDNTRTSMPRWEFECAFQTCAPHLSILEVTLWDANLLREEEEGEEERQEEAREWGAERGEKERHDGVSEGEETRRAEKDTEDHKGAKVGGWHFNRQVVDYYRHSYTSTAYLGAFMVSLTQLADHMGEDMSLNCRLIWPTASSLFVSAARRVQAAVRRRLEGRALFLSRWEARTRRSRFRVFVLAARHLPVTAMKEEDLHFARSGGLNRYLPQYDCFLRLRMEDGQRRCARGVRWNELDEVCNMRGGLVTDAVPAPAKFPDHVLAESSGEMRRSRRGREIRRLR